MFYSRFFATPLFLFVLGLVFTGQGLDSVGAGPKEAEASSKPAKRVVVAPRSGQVLRSNTVLLRVRSSDRSGRLIARLNGVRIDEEFRRSRNGTRDLRVSLSHGLRRGRNVLKVKVFRHGLPTHRAAVRFFLRRKQALVGAGRDRRVVVGSRSLLIGEVRAKQKAGKATPRWKVIKSPGGQKRPARLTTPNRAGSGFVASRLGTYILELRHSEGKVLTADRVKIDVVPPNPMVPIETIPHVGDRPWGIKVGSSYYEVKDPRRFIQVVVLKRKTLALVANESLDDASSLSDFIKGFDDTNLVIVTRSKANYRGGFRGFSDSMNRIGVPDINKSGWSPNRVAPEPGEFSAIGVPGMDVGTADYRAYDQQSRTEPYFGGDMRGYLIPDQYRNYGYVASDEEPIAFGGAQVAPESTKVGYKLGVFEAHTLEPRPGNGEVFDINGGFLAEGEATAEVKRMTAALNAVGDNDVVTIQAASKLNTDKTAYEPPIDDDVSKDAMVDLVAAVQRVGGTANAFNRAATVAGVKESGGAVYGLVGWAGAGKGKGAEVAAGVAHAGDVPVLNTVLRPDNQSMFRPTEVAESAGGPAALSELALKPPTTAWPLDNDPGASRAIIYLGSQDEELGPDPRSAYWTQNLDTDALIRTLSSVTFPDGKSFTRDEFDRAKAQLIKELGWVGKVRRYLAQLSTPFSENALPSWEASKTIADRIYDDAHATDSKITFNWLEFVEALVGLVPIFGEEVQSATETLSLLFEFAARTYGAVDQGGEPSDRDVAVESSKLGAELLAEAQQMQASIRSMGDVIVSDYAKLSVLGPHAGCNSRDPECPKEFAYSESDRAAASADVYRGIERIAYTKLVPLGYHVYRLSDRQGADAPDIRSYFCLPGSVTWSDYPNPSQNSATMLETLDPDGVGSVWGMYGLAKPRGNSEFRPTYPGNGILDRMFGPVSKSGDPKAGGLSIDFEALIPKDPDYWNGSKYAEDFYCRQFQ